MRKAKEEFFASLDPGDKKKFWKTIRSISTNKPFVPVLLHGSQLASTDWEKAEMLSRFFAEFFNKAQPPLTPNSSLSFDLSGDCPEIYFALRKR